MLTPRLREEAVATMIRFLGHPITSIFRHTLNTDDDFSGYLRVVPQPIDLSMILTRLESEQYTSIQEWLNDVELIWSNCEQYCASLPPLSPTRRLHGILASENRRLFKKESQRFEGLILSNWCRNVYARRTQVTKLMTQPPGKIKQFTASLGAARVTRQTPGGMSEREMSCFVSAAAMMQSDSDHRDLINLLTQLEPEWDLDNGNPTLAVDVTRLKPTTIQAVKAFMKAALERQGANYPE
jgi:hypothetical protein